MPPGPKDTSRLGCAHVGGDKETSRESVDWVDALRAYGKKTCFGLARNRILMPSAVWARAARVALLRDRRCTFIERDWSLAISRTAMVKLRTTLMVGERLLQLRGRHGSQSKVA